MIRFTPLFLLSLAAALAGCGAKDGPAPSREAALTTPGAVIDAVRNATTGLVCAPDAPFDARCGGESVSFSSGQLRWSRDDGRRILVIDQGLKFQAVARLRNRVHTYLTADATGAFAPATPSVRMSRAYAEVNARLLGASDVFVGTDALEAAFPQWGSLWGEERDLQLGHGAPILSLLADLSPGATFVLAEPWVLPESLLCTKDFPGILAFAEKARDTLLAAVRTHGVTHINLSMGDSVETMLADYRRRCPTRPALDRATAKDLVLLLTPLYKGLANEPGVMLVQAAPNGPGDHPLDCAQEGYEHRVRVGYTELRPSAIPADGATLFEYWDRLPSSQHAVQHCIDLFVNAPGSFVPRALEVGDLPLYSPDGFKRGIATFATTSWATPVALAYLRHERHEAPIQAYAALTDTGLFKIHDPLRHGAFGR